MKEDKHCIKVCVCRHMADFDVLWILINCVLEKQVFSFHWSNRWKLSQGLDENKTKLWAFLLILPWSLQMLIMEKIILKTLGDVVAYVHGADGKAMKEVKQGRILLDWEQI